MFLFAKSIGSHGSENILRFHSIIQRLRPPTPRKFAYDNYCLNCALEYVLLPGTTENNSGGAGRGRAGSKGVTNTLYYRGFEIRGHAFSFR